MDIKARLNQLADEKYRLFSAALLPGVSTPLLGVRMPALRQLAKELVRRYGEEALLHLTQDSLEEIMLQGIIIGLLKGTPQEAFKRAETFIPRINCWSVCDCFCAGFTTARTHPQETWEFLQPYFKDKREYFFRTAVVTGLFHFAKPPYAARLIQRLKTPPTQAFYAQMAVAWALAELALSVPQEVLAFLQQNTLDKFTHNKAIQKMQESFRVPPEVKEAARALRRPR